MRSKTIIISALILCLLAAAVYFGVRNGRELGNEITANDFEDAQTDEEAEDLLEEFEDEDDEEAPPMITTLEEALPVFEEVGYKKSEDGYKAEDNEDGVKSERIIKAEGNHAVLNLKYDYGSSNNEMKDFYKEDPDKAVSRMIASFLVTLAEEANIEKGDMEYVVYVGGDKVAKGTMSIKEARKLDAMSPE